MKSIHDSESEEYDEELEEYDESTWDKDSNEKEGERE